MEPSDEALCQGVAARDDAAFDLLVSRWQERAYRIAWSILRDADDARDVSQEAFLRVYERADRFEGRARFSTWFYRIVVNLCLDHRRRHGWWRRMVCAVDGSGSGEQALERQPAPGPAVDDVAAERQTMSRVQREVERLSPQQRAAVMLQVEGLPTVEIASIMGCSEATVRVHLHRALGTLRKSMGSRP